MFETLLGGHPIAISLAGSFFKNNSIEVVYENLIKTALLNTLTEGTNLKTDVTNNLFNSLNLSLKLYNDKKIYEFFHMMGYFPGGAREEDIDHVWKAIYKGKPVEWKPFCRYCENASIIIRKKVKFKKDSIEIYQLVPMLKNIAEESQENSERKKLHRVVTAYYIKILSEILQENSVSKESKDNEVLMNNLWFFEMNVWDCVYRALEIRKTMNLNRIDTIGTDDNQSNAFNKSLRKNKPSKDEEDEYDRLESVDDNIIARSGTSNDIFNKFTDYDPSTDLVAVMEKNRKEEEKEIDKQNVFGELVNKLLPQIMPKSGQAGEIEDKNVLSFIEKSVMPDKATKKPSMLIKPKPKIKKKKIENNDINNASFLIREMDKRLKKTVNDKVSNIIKNFEGLSKLSNPKEEIYEQLAHKLFESQEKHKLYKGNATNEVYKKGKTIKEISDDSKILILYLSNLILFSK